MKKILYYFIFLHFFIPLLGFAGAWVQKKGEVLNIITAQRYISDQFFTPAGRITSSPTYAKNFLSNYTEFGVTGKLTMGILLSALKSHTSASGTQGGINDTMLFGRYLLWKSDYSALSLQFYGDKMGRAAQFNIPPSNSSFNSGEAILVGTSGQFKSKAYWFADACVGLVQRYSAGNQLIVNLEAGYKFSNEKTWLMLQNYNTVDIDNFNMPKNSNYTLVTIVPSIVFWVNKVVGFQFGMTQDVFGQNVGRGRSVFIANWLNF